MYLTDHGIIVHTDLTAFPNSAVTSNLTSKTTLHVSSKSDKNHKSSGRINKLFSKNYQLFQQLLFTTFYVFDIYTKRYMPLSKAQ